MVYHYGSSFTWRFTNFTIQKMATFPTKIQEIVARAQEAAEEGVCHIELASEEPWFRSMGCILYNDIYIYNIYILLNI